MTDVIPIHGETKPCGWNLADDVAITPCERRALSEVDGYRLCLVHISSYAQHKRIWATVPVADQHGV
jgi:hypothetical protein